VLLREPAGSRILQGYSTRPLAFPEGRVRRFNPLRPNQTLQQRRIVVSHIARAVAYRPGKHRFGRIGTDQVHRRSGRVETASRQAVRPAGSLMTETKRESGSTPPSMNSCAAPCRGLPQRSPVATDAATSLPRPYKRPTRVRYPARFLPPQSPHRGPPCRTAIAHTPATAALSLKPHPQP
jgi:hypothetical protein